MHSSPLFGANPPFRTQHRTGTLAVLVGAILLSLIRNPAASEPPHGMACSECHLNHDILGNPYSGTAGDANLCLSCHTPGGQADRFFFTDADQAQLSSGQGTSHPWDSQTSGRVVAEAESPAGALLLEGTFTGRYAKSYSILITSPGAAGTARFNWWSSAPIPTGGTNLTTGQLVPVDIDDEGYVTYEYVPAELEAGIRLRFLNARPSPAFRAGDRWQLFLRPGLNPPSNPELLLTGPDRSVTCSTCHDPHTQQKEPFDPAAPPYAAGGGAGRHFLRADNDKDQMCADCHRALYATNSLVGMHRVGLPVSTNSTLRLPSTLPLDKHDSTLGCSTCHQPHYSPAEDGTLLRADGTTSLCTECHLGIDDSKPARHLMPLDGNLWPGGSYGSLLPADSNPDHRGSCATCHRVHGWPNGSSSSGNYPSLLVEREENLCFTCHDGSPAAKNLRANFSKAYKHPVALAGRHSPDESGNPAKFGAANRHSECADCHNVHQLASDTLPVPAPGASANLKGVAHVSVNNSSSKVTYAFHGPEDSLPAKEYEVCFVCHSSWTTQPAGQADYAAKFNSENASFHPVEAPGRNSNINVNSFVNGWSATAMMTCTDCHTSDDTSIRGPHGSSFQYILKKRAIASPARRSTAMTSDELCFDCHRFDTYANNSASSTIRNYSRFSGSEGHTYHVGSRRYSCYNCHDTHGSATQSGLIVTGRSPGINSYTRTATGGSCSPTCHGSESYSVTYPR